MSYLKKINLTEQDLTTDSAIVDSCRNSCTAACSASCSDNCKGECKYTCVIACANDCNATCVDTCYDTCSHTAGNVTLSIGSTKITTTITIDTSDYLHMPFTKENCDEVYTGGDKLPFKIMLNDLETDAYIFDTPNIMSEGETENSVFSYVISNIQSGKEIECLEVNTHNTFKYRTVEIEESEEE